MTETLTTIAEALDATIARLGTELRAAQAARDALSTALNGEAAGITPEQIEEARTATAEGSAPIAAVATEPRAARQSRAAIHRAVGQAFAALWKEQLGANEISVGEIAMRVMNDLGREDIDTRTVSSSLDYGRRHGWAKPGKRGMWIYTGEDAGKGTTAQQRAVYEPTDDGTEDGATDEGNHSSVEQG